MLDGPETPRVETWLLISSERVGDLNLPSIEAACDTDLQQSHLDCWSYGHDFKDNLERENQQSQLPPVVIRAVEGTDHKDLKRRIWNYLAVNNPQALPVACSVDGSTRKPTNFMNSVQGKYIGLSLTGSVEGVISPET